MSSRKVLSIKAYINKIGQQTVENVCFWLIIGVCIIPAALSRHTEIGSNSNK